MRRVSAEVVILVATVLCLIAGESRAKPQAEHAVAPRKFVVFDNIGYAGKPHTRAAGLINCNIIYDSRTIWKDQANRIPDEAAFKKAVIKRACKPGPIVIDIEGVKLSGNRKEVEEHFRLFMNLVKWVHEAAPGRTVGYYGHGLFPERAGKEFASEAKRLAEAVDAFFPSMYTFKDDRVAWKNKVDDLIQRAHELTPGKPVYPYIWPQYHRGASKQLQFIDGAYWKFQLDTVRKCGARGVVIWSSESPGWNAKAEWWQATLKFISK